MYFQYQKHNIYYHISGEGKPLVFLHGNTASSKMFDFILPLYSGYQIILIDFLGYGLSERVEHLSDQLWYDESLQTIALLDYLQLKKVHLIGSSGGAWVAINVALQRPDLIDKVVADSFDGRTLHESFLEDLLTDRRLAMKQELAVQIYQWWIGEDWEHVVELDTESMIQLVQNHYPLFHYDIAQLQNPLLLLGSLEDQLLRKDLTDEYQAIVSTVANGNMIIFEQGQHPAILSQAENAAIVIQNFFKEE